MAVDLSLIPQNRVAELVSKLSSLESSITTNNNNAVHKTGNETIAGVKTFTSETTFTRNIIGKVTEVIRGTAPSSNVYKDIKWVDNNYAWLGGFEYIQNTDKSSNIRWIISDSVNNTGNVAGSIRLGQDSSGNVYTEAPTPGTSDNSTKIATTAYVRNQNYVPQSSLIESKVVITTYSNDTQWYRVWSDGWIEQGGRITSTSSSGTLTYNKAFTNTKYVLVATEGDTSTAEASGSDTSGFGENIGFTNFTTSSSRYSIASGRFFTWYACGY